MRIWRYFALALCVAGSLRAENWVVVTGGQFNGGPYTVQAGQAFTVSVELKIEKDVDYGSSTEDRIRFTVKIPTSPPGGVLKVRGFYGAVGAEVHYANWGANADILQIRTVEKNKRFILGWIKLKDNMPGGGNLDSDWEPNAGDQTAVKANGIGWTGTGDSDTGSVAMVSVPWTFTNPKNYDVKLVFTDGSGNVLQSTVIPALQTVSKASAGNVLKYAASLSVTAKLYIPAKYENGSWVSVDDIDDGDSSVIVFDGHEFSSPGQSPPLEPVIALPFPEGAPSNGTIPPSSQPVWSAGGDTSPLENGIYKEGVEKQLGMLAEIEEHLSGVNVTGNNTAFTTTTNATFSGDATVLTEVEAMLPSAPEVFPTTLTSSSSYTFTMTFPEIGERTVTLDLEPYETGVSFVRGLLKALIAVFFFLVTIQTIRRVFV